MRQSVKSSIFCIIKYLALFVLVFLSLRLIFGYFNLSYSNADNARYLLSAMAQSQAAIIAIVITLSLVAIQLGASAYSPRVINIFKNSPDIWILLSLYVASISYDFIILKILSEKVGEHHIFISYWLCTSAFLALFPYLRSVINILRPEAIIKRLSWDILTSLKLKDWKNKDPFQPIDDIIRNSFMRYDYETARRGLKEMSDKAVEVVSLYNAENNKKRYESVYAKPLKTRYEVFSEYYCNHIKELGELFAERNERLTLETIENLERFRTIITKKKLGTEEDIVKTLESIGKISAGKGFQEATKHTIDIIGIIGKSLPYEDYVITTSHGHKYPYPFKEIVGHVISALGNIGVLAIEKWGAYMLHFVGRSLQTVGVYVVEKGPEFEWQTVNVARIFNNIGINTLIAEKSPTYSELYGIIEYSVIKPLCVIGKITHEKGIKSGFERSAFALWDIGTYAKVGGFDGAASGAAKALAELAILDEEIIKVELDTLKRREKDIESLQGFREFFEMYDKYLKELGELKDENNM